MGKGEELRAFPLDPKKNPDTPKCNDWHIGIDRKIRINGCIK